VGGMSILNASVMGLFSAAALLSGCVSSSVVKPPDAPERLRPQRIKRWHSRRSPRACRSTSARPAETNRRSCGAAVINYAVLLSWFLAFRFAHDWMYRLHKRWFRIPVEQFDAIHYGSMAMYKIGVILFNLVPYVALLIVARWRS
jgi:hypothetical protein